MGWKSWLNVDTVANVTISLLNIFNSIIEQEMERQVSIRTPEEYNDARHIYIAVWHSIISQPKKEMKAHRAAIGNDGPALLWQLYYSIPSASRTYASTSRTYLRVNNIMLINYKIELYRIK